MFETNDESDNHGDMLDWLFKSTIEPMVDREISKVTIPWERHKRDAWIINRDLGYKASGDKTLTLTKYIKGLHSNDLENIGNTVFERKFDKNSLASGLISETSIFIFLAGLLNLERHTLVTDTAGGIETVAREIETFFPALRYVISYALIEYMTVNALGKPPQSDLSYTLFPTKKEMDEFYTS